MPSRMNHYASCSPAPARMPEILRSPFRTKTFFDGTKLAVVVAPAENHYGWYESEMR